MRSFLVCAFVVCGLALSGNGVAGASEDASGSQITQIHHNNYFSVTWVHHKERFSVPSATVQTFEIPFRSAQPNTPTGLRDLAA